MNTLRGFYAACCALAVGIYIFTDNWIWQLCRWAASHDQNWWQVWISSLSGWAAAFGALVAACLTLPHLKRQSTEALRQTGFLLGEANPTMTAAHPQGRFEDFVLRIVNWNKYSFDILEIIVEECSHEIAWQPDEISIGNQTVKTGPSGKFTKIYRVNGWEDRNHPPSFANITTYVALADNEIASEEEFTIKFAAQLLLHGERPKLVEVRASVVTTVKNLSL